MTASLAVLITYYDEELLIKECLDSLLDQPNHPDEILIFDDNSLLPARNYIPSSYPVKILRGKTNQGPGFGRNVLLHNSQSDYIHFQDADDLFHPDWCKEVRRAVTNTNADIILTDITSIQEDKVISKTVMDIERLTTIGDLVKFGLMGSILVPSTTFRRSIALRIGGYRTREILPQSEDFDFHIRLAATGASYTAISTPLIFQRLRSGSHSQNQTLCWTSALESVRLLAQELPVTYHSDLAEASSRIGSTLFSLQAYADAKRAFQLAQQLGTPYFQHRHSLYRTIANVLGQEFTEWLGFAYRKVLPTSLRRAIGLHLRT